MAGTAAGEMACGWYHWSERVAQAPGEIRSSPLEVSPRMKLEVCVDTVAGLEQAAACGVDRIELCQGLDLGGLTPSLAMMRYAASLHVPTFALIRPRPGNFV